MYGLNLNGQGNYNQDTLWLNSGEIIPCKLIDKTLRSTTISINFKDEDGNKTFSQYPEYQVKRIKSGNKVLLGPKYLYLSPPTKQMKIFAGFGFGYPAYVGVRNTVLFKNNLGFSVNFGGYFPVDNGPFENPDIISSTDRYFVISSCFVAAFNTAKPGSRFSLELGPAWVIYSKSIKYKCYTLFCFGNPVVKKQYPDVIGLSARVNYGILLSDGFGIQISIGGNLNKYASVYSIGFNLIFGRIRDKWQKK